MLHHEDVGHTKKKLTLEANFISNVSKDKSILNMISICDMPLKLCYILGMLTPCKRHVPSPYLHCFVYKMKEQSLRQKVPIKKKYIQLKFGHKLFKIKLKMAREVTSNRKTHRLNNTKSKSLLVSQYCSQTLPKATVVIVTSIIFTDGQDFLPICVSVEVAGKDAAYLINFLQFIFIHANVINSIWTKYKRTEI